MTQPPIVPGQPQPQVDPYGPLAWMPTPPPAPKRPGWVVPMISALLAMVVVLGATAIWFAMRSRPVALSATAPSRPATTAPPATTRAATDLVFGLFALFDDKAGWKEGGTCKGTGGFSDIQDGAQVKVTGPTGEVLGLGELKLGAPHALGARVACVYGFSVAKVPTGKGFYGIEISHRGVVQYPESEVFSGDLSLTLGENR